jgi:hypothetical protein
MIESSALQLLTPECVASRNLGEPQRALFQYFAGLKTVREEVNANSGCPLLLVQYGRHPSAPEIAGYRILWDGHRRGDDTERYVLYRKNSP